METILEEPPLYFLKSDDLFSFLTGEDFCQLKLHENETQISLLIEAITLKKKQLEEEAAAIEKHPYFD